MLRTKAAKKATNRTSPGINAGQFPSRLERVVTGKSHGGFEKNKGLFGFSAFNMYFRLSTPLILAPKLIK